MYNDKYICTSCGRSYDEEDAEVYVKKEYMGECHGAPADEELEYICCPFCGSDRYEEATMDDNAARHINELVDQKEYYEHRYGKLQKQSERKAAYA